VSRWLKVAVLALVAMAVIAGEYAVVIARGAAAASAYAAYLVPPRSPRVVSPYVKRLLTGSAVSTAQRWIVVRLKGAPYQIGFQNGFLTAQSADYFIQVDLGAPGNASRQASDRIARDYIWRLIPIEYREELQGITTGLHAAGYKKDTLWDVVAANAWADIDCYARLLPRSAARAEVARGALAARKGGCSAFIATGAATADGKPVMGHNTWTAYDENFMYNVMFYVQPQRGYRFCYQSAGGLIWSGQDWYENSAGLLLTETTLADTTYNTKGRPVFVRARTAIQYDRTVAQAVPTLLRHNNGAYSNEWLIGDRSGTIASLQLGNRAYDLHVTGSGFFGSSNFDWGWRTRAEEGSVADSYSPANGDRARYVRWKELAAAHFGHINAAVGKAMEADTYDTYLKKRCPDERTICGEPEHGSSGVPYSGSDDGGAYDAKVTTEAMVSAGLTMWARWGHPNGDGFSAQLFLQHNPTWAADNGSLAMFGLRTFSAMTPNPWVLLTRP
jgi:hypothetical protein